MKQYDAVIIGGSAAGPVAGISCRRRYPDKSVAIIREEEQVLIPCGIPYIVGTVGSPQNNLIPDKLLSNNGIDLIKGKAIDIDREKKTVSLADGSTVGYDKLIMATGSLPIELPIPGLDKENVFTVKKDVAYLEGMMNTMNQVKDVVIIGGGFIGVEFADECRKHRDCKDCSVSIVEVLPRCLQLALDEKFCAETEEVLKERKINVFTGKKVTAILGDGKVSGVKLGDNEELNAEMVIVGVGAKPNTSLAEKAGLQLGQTKAIKVDSTMRTLTDSNIFACGDCAEKASFFNGRLSRLMLASIATTEARIAGVNIYGACCTNPGAIGLFCTLVGGRAFGCAGLTEAAAKREGFNVITGESAGPDRHPGGMPGASNVSLKLVFCHESRHLLGGSASGGTSIGELMNVIGACIQHSMTAYDISLLQVGTHPALTASPIAYQLVNAAELAIKAMK